MRKKKVLIHSNFCKAFTGFGKHKKNLLKYLYETDKYELVELVNSQHTGNEELKLLPWKCIGTLPDDPIAIHQAQKDQKRLRDMGYGHETIDKIIIDEKPDIYLGIEDVWAFDGFIQRDWWDKIHCIIHTTLDSLPILPEAVRIAPHVEHYYVWASFAEKAMKKMGYDHVKTIRGTLDTDNFFKISKEKRVFLRKKFNISNDFVVGFVFRNQLRKSAPNLLDGFSLFKKNNPKAQCKLLLHTHWSEGWNIPNLIQEKGINPKDVLTTYFCKGCKQYNVQPFVMQGIDCPNCKAKGSMETTNIANGVDEEQLNEIYNLMDVYCHPFTSGGQEIPVQEAKLAELITLVTNYSCGEDCCTEESGGMPLEWAEYREPGTQFIKASTSAFSICKQITKVYNMKPEKREAIGKKARQFIIDNFSIEVVGKQFEDLFDSFEPVDWDNIKISKFKERDPAYIPDDKLPNDKWLIDLYSNCLKMKVNDKDEGFRFWMSEFMKGKQRQDVLGFFHQTATKENKDFKHESLTDLVDKKRPNKRIAYIMPYHGEDVLASTSVVNSLKDTYPEHDIYFFTDKMYFDLVDHCDSIYKICEYTEDMDFDCFHFIGRADQEGVFDLAFFPHKETKKSVDYINHGRGKLQYSLIE